MGAMMGHRGSEKLVKKPQKPHPTPLLACNLTAGVAPGQLASINRLWMVHTSWGTRQTAWEMIMTSPQKGHKKL